ncbi:hypothetical protein MHU86_9887 [Fragilaria crotonensis]|nr:hypothetical protein MHU86_9887 [Fragilaria crotonensis]
MDDENEQFNMIPVEDDSVGDIISSASHPGSVHRILSEIPYGEEDEAFLHAISTEVALQVPWTTQLRLCLRSPTTLHKLLLPHVWNRVQQCLHDDVDGNGYHHDSASGFIYDESWKQDAMIQNWRLTRFHIQRDLRLLPRTLRQIMERIDSVLGVGDELTLSFDGDHLIVDTAKSPLSVLQDYRQQKKHELLNITSASVSTTPHQNFSAWVATHTECHRQHKICQELCRQIGLNRSRLNLLEEHLHSLPVPRVVRELVVLQSSQDEVVRKGLGLCAALLKRRGVDIQLDPLPPELILCDSKHLEHVIKSYLYLGLPNVNSLVVYLWAHQSMDMVVRFASWLPVEPVVPLLQRSLTHDDNNWEQGIDIFLALPWEERHLLEIFAPLLGSNVPTDPAVLKQACRTHFLGKHAAIKSICRQTSQLSTNEIVQRVWGRADTKVGNSGYGMPQKDWVADVGDSDESDDEFDETNDEILLL